MIEYICGICGKNFGRDDDVWMWHLEIDHRIYDEISEEDYDLPFPTKNKG